MMAMRGVAGGIMILVASGCVALVPFVKSDYDSYAQAEPGIVRSAPQLSISAKTSIAAPPVVRRDYYVERLMRVLNHPEPVKRVNAATTLGMLGSRARIAVPVLTEKLRDRHKWVRRAAAQALGKIGDKRALEPLRLARSDKDKWVAYSANRAWNKLR